MPVYGQVLNSCFIDVGSYAPYVKNEIKCPAINSGKFKDCKECNVMQIVAPDELTFLAVLLDHFRLRIRTIVQSVQSKIFTLASSTEEMSASITSLSQNINDQAASAEEISASIEESTVGVEKIANSSNEQFKSITDMTSKMDALSDRLTS